MASGAATGVVEGVTNHAEAESILVTSVGCGMLGYGIVSDACGPLADSLFNCLLSLFSTKDVGAVPISLGPSIRQGYVLSAPRFRS